MPPTRSGSQSGKKNTKTPGETAPASRPKRTIKPVTKELPTLRARPKPKITRKTPKSSALVAPPKPDSPNPFDSEAKVEIPEKVTKCPPLPRPIIIICNFTVKLDGELVFKDSVAFNIHHDATMYKRIRDDAEREIKEYIERKFPLRVPDQPTYWTLLFGAKKRRESKRLKLIGGNVYMDWKNAMSIVLIKSRSGCQSIDVNVGYCLQYPPGYEPPTEPIAATKAKGAREVSHIFSASSALLPPNGTVDHLAERHRAATQQVAPQSRTSATSKALKQLHQQRQQEQCTWRGYRDELFRYWVCNKRDCVNFVAGRAC